jgi:hypothetical protein
MRDLVLSGYFLILFLMSPLTVYVRMQRKIAIGLIQERVYARLDFHAVE